MYNLKSKRLILFAIIILPLTLIMSACEPGGYLIIENQSSDEVKVFVAHVRENGTIDGLTEFGVVSTQTTKQINVTFLGPDWVNRIQIKDPAGTVVFSHDYTMPELEKIHWKIVVSP